MRTFRLMELLEDIIRIPIFYQIAVFPLQFAIFLYLIETVSSFMTFVLLFFLYSYYNLLLWLFQNITTFSLNLATYICGFVFLLCLNYMLCFFITAATLNAMSIGDRIFDLHWYQLARSEQFIVHIMIQRSQEPFQLKGLGVFVCSLETYLMVNESH